MSSLTRAFSHRVLAPASPPGWKELAAAGLLFTAMAFVVFGWYAFHGGFIADDWVNAGRYYLHPGSGFWDAVGNYQTPSRPVAAFYVTLTYAVLGLHTHQHLVLAVLLAAFLSIAYFTFLRTIGLGTLLALAAAALLLVFPSSDSTRLWSTGSQINLFIGLYLVAAVIAIAGRRRFGPEPTRAAVATQVLASVLAVTAVAGYEIVAPAVLLSVFLYRWIDPRGAVWRWLLDAIPTLLLLIFVTSQFRDGGDQGTQLLTNLRLMADGGLSVLSYSLVPSREVSRWLVFGGLAALLAGVLVARRFAARRPDLDAIGPWLASLALAIVAIAIGYVMLVPAGADYPPYSPGVQNRANCFAALGICLFVVLLAAGLGALAAAIPKASEATRGRVRVALAGVLILGLLGVYTVRIDESSDRWRRVAEIQPGILASSQELVPSPEPEATIFTSGFPGYSAPGIPIFGGGGNEDEVGAFKVIYDEPEIRAFPLLDQIGLDCGALRVSTPDAPNSPTRYGRAIIIDPLARRVYRPRTQRQCDEVVEAIPFGPSYLSGAW